MVFILTEYLRPYMPRHRKPRDLPSVPPPPPDDHDASG